MEVLKNVSLEEIEKLFPKNYVEKVGEKRYQGLVNYMTRIKSDPTIPRMLRVHYKKEYIGMVYGTYVSGLKMAVDMLKELNDFKYKTIDDMQIVLDDSLAWNYIHFINDASYG